MSSFFLSFFLCISFFLPLYFLSFLFIPIRVLRTVEGVYALYEWHAALREICSIASLPGKRLFLLPDIRCFHATLHRSDAHWRCASYGEHCFVTVPFSYNFIV